MAEWYYIEQRHNKNAQLQLCRCTSLNRGDDLKNIVMLNKSEITALWLQYNLNTAILKQGLTEDNRDLLIESNCELKAILRKAGLVKPSVVVLDDM